MTHKPKLSDSLPTLVLGVGFVCWGVVMIAKGQVVVGTSSRTLQTNAYGGHLLIFFGVVFLYITWASLSPYSKIKRFFERRRKKRK